MTMIVNRLDRDDWRDYRRARLVALSEEGTGLGGSYEREAELPDQHWIERLDEPDIATLGGRTGGGLPILGLITIEPPVWRPEIDQRQFYLGNMWVSVEARGTGLATLLIETAFEHATRAGATSVNLLVADNNMVAQRVFRRHGFEPTGVSFGPSSPGAKVYLEFLRPLAVAAG